MVVYATSAIFRPSPWWDPRLVVPIAGMVLNNSISGPSVALDRLLAEVCERTHETETRLAFGATCFESVLPAVRNVIQTALRPLMNILTIVGLVSIPGTAKHFFLVLLHIGRSYSLFLSFNVEFIFGSP